MNSSECIIVHGRGCSVYKSSTCNVTRLDTLPNNQQHHPYLHHGRHCIGMAENIYSKGTRVWFEDKDQAWLSAEVTSVTKGSDDTIKLVFIDERGKVQLR